MRIFAIKRFNVWAEKHSLTHELLQNAVSEIERGLVDANLGSNLYKKRVATKGRGKSGSVRTILAYSKGQRTFFLYAFEKSDRDNMTRKEKESLQELGKLLLMADGHKIRDWLTSKGIVEITKRKEN